MLIKTPFHIALQPVVRRSELLKQSYKGFYKNLQSTLLTRNQGSNDNSFTCTWEDFITAAFDSYYSGWRHSLLPNVPVPLELIANLPITTGEIVTLGTWLLCKNIYRFDSEVAEQLSKSEFKGDLPIELLNFPDLALYIQTDNCNFTFENKKIYGVVYAPSTLNNQKVLVCTIFFESGIPQTTVLVLKPEISIEDSINLFISDFNSTGPKLSQDQQHNHVMVQKKLINLLLWFSQSEPDYELLPGQKIQNKPFHWPPKIDNDFRLFEQKKYQFFTAGTKCGNQIRILNEDICRARLAGESPGRLPHIRKAHYHLYWIGKRGSRMEYKIHFIPNTLVKGVIKEEHRN